MMQKEECNYKMMKYLLNISMLHCKFKIRLLYCFDSSIGFGGSIVFDAYIGLIIMTTISSPLRFAKTLTVKSTRILSTRYTKLLMTKSAKTLPIMRSKLMSMMSTMEDKEDGKSKEDITDTLSDVDPINVVSGVDPTNTDSEIIFQTLIPGSYCIDISQLPYGKMVVGESRSKVNIKGDGINNNSEIKRVMINEANINAIYFDDGKIFREDGDRTIVSHCTN